MPALPKQEQEHTAHRHAGGHGQIPGSSAARRLGRTQPVGMIRKPEQVSDLREDGVEPAIIDLEATDTAEMTELVRGADAVVFAAGGGPDGNAARKETVDKGAAIMLADAAEAAGVRRYVMVSAMGTEQADPDSDDVMQVYLRAKQTADDYVGPGTDLDHLAAGMSPTRCRPAGRVGPSSVARSPAATWPCVGRCWRRRTRSARPSKCSLATNR